MQDASKIEQVHSFCSLTGDIHRGNEDPVVDHLVDDSDGHDRTLFRGSVDQPEIAQLVHEARNPARAIGDLLDRLLAEFGSPAADMASRCLTYPATVARSIAGMW